MFLVGERARMPDCGNPAGERTGETCTPLEYVLGPKIMFAERD